MQDQVFKIKIENDKPIWLYCAQNAPKSHCQAGMVMAVNPPKTGANTFDAFKALAQAVTANSTAPTSVNGGQFTTPSASPSATGSPSDSPGAAASLFASGGIAGGLMAVFAALLM
jgi:hypothetical protein